jgi:hypothetical protein
MQHNWQYGVNYKDIPYLFHMMELVAYNQKSQYFEDEMTLLVSSGSHFG